MQSVYFTGPADWVNGICARNYSILNSNRENKLVESDLDQVNSQLIGIKFRVNKKYTLQFSIKSGGIKDPNK